MVSHSTKFVLILNICFNFVLRASHSNYWGNLHILFICLIKYAKQNIQQSPALLEILRIRLVGGKVLKLCPNNTLPPPPSPASLQFLYFIIGSLLYLFLGHRPHFLTWKICRLEGWGEVDNAKVGDRLRGWKEFWVFQFFKGISQWSVGRRKAR